MTDEDFLRATLGHLDLVHSLARRLMPSREAAEDLVQETYLRALQGWRKQPPDAVAPWLATICLNTGRSTFRRAAVRPVEILDADAGRDVSAPADVERQVIGRLDAEAVHRALWRLPEAQREAITLMDLCGFTAAEVAEMIGSPRGTVLARVHRGHKALAELVREEVYDSDA